MKYLCILKIVFVVLLVLIISTLILGLCKEKMKNGTNNTDDLTYFKNRINLISIKNPIKINSIYRNIKIYVINMQKDVERKMHMIDLLNKLNFTNVEFVTPIKITEEYNTKYFKHSNMCNSGKSLMLTVLNILHYNKDLEFFIMEDDIDIYSNLSINLVLDEHYSKRKDLLYLEFCYIPCNQLYKEKNCDILYALNNNVSCTGCILYNKDAVKKILDAFNNNNNLYKYPIDQAYRMINTITKQGYPIFRQNIKFNSNIFTSARYNKKNNTLFDPVCTSNS